MNLYRTTGQSGADSFKTLWSGSQADASKDRVALKKEGLKHVETDAMDVPTSKVDLLAWLNKEAA